MNPYIPPMESFLMPFQKLSSVKWRQQAATIQSAGSKEEKEGLPSAYVNDKEC
jgi:hypothetical protein